MKGSRKGSEIKQHKSVYLNPAQIRQTAKYLNDYDNIEYLLCYKLLLISGLKYAPLARIRFGDYNSITGFINSKHKPIKITQSVIKVIDYLRLSATSESQKIIKIKYPVFWRVLTTCLFKAKIDGASLGTKLLRNTYAHRHFNLHQDKQRLKKDMCLSSLRYLPKSVFKTHTMTLFDDVL